MGARNVLRLWQAALEASEEITLDSGDSLNIVPAVDDQGALNIGSAALDMDLKIFLGGDESYALFDSGAKALTLSGVTLDMGGGAATLDGDVTLSGASTLTGTLKASADGWIGRKIVTEAGAARTVDATDFSAIIMLTGAAGATTVTLPAPAAANLGAKVTVVSLSDDAHVVTLTDKIVTLADIVASSVTANEVDKSGQAVTLVSDGSGKWIVTSQTGDWAVGA